MSVLPAKFMKFLTFADVHADMKQVANLVERSANVDFVLCVGDFTQFGKGFNKVMDAFAKLKKEFLVIPGNHESDRMLKDKLRPYPFAVNLHKQAVIRGEYVFLGFGEGGFVQQEPEFRKVSRDWYGQYNGKKVILVTHGPPFNTTLDLLEKQHVGNKDYTKFIQRINAKMAISGHIHENAGTIDTLGTTKLLNPGWEGMVVELP